MTAKKRECPNCGHAGMIHGVRDVEHCYRGQKLSVHGIKGWHCPDCHEVEFDPGEGARYEAAIRRFAEKQDEKVALDLARIRKKLGLTQQKAALIAGGGPNAFSRYEKRKAKPLPAVVNLFRLLDRHPELLAEVLAQSEAA
jgi:HTH-type transcriptional regulator/antitoxin MqsA